MNKSKKSFNGQQKAKMKREGVISRLEYQLIHKTKVLNKEKHKELGGSGIIGLEEQDIKRIKSELLILKSRV
jgi:hypothetical protein